MIAVNNRLLLESQLISAGCKRDLKQSNPVLALPYVDGAFTDGRLTAPLATRFEYETRGEQTVARTVGGWDAPDWLAELSYDLVAPFTLHPVGELPQHVREWGREQRLRVIGMLPFVYEPAIEWERFPDQLRKAGFPPEFVESGSILLLVPGEELLRKPFVEWDRERDNQLVVSALWDVPKNRVLWAEGFQDRKSIRKRGVGKPLDEWLKPYRD
ncbi:hypothetical protein GC176_28060 [bacterium]|nr:hypothetical protein [bacterium]